MLIYAGTKSDFMVDTENDRLETKLYENIKLNTSGQQKASGTCERIRTPFWRDDRLFLYVKNVFAVFL